MGIDAGGYVECENRALPAFLSSYKSKFELAFIHQSADVYKRQLWCC